MTASKPTGRRLFRRVAQIRGIDLADGDVIRIDGVWREVLDVFTSDSNPTTVYLADSAEARTLAEQVVEQDWHVGVRYLVDEKSRPGEIEDALAILRTVDLVDIQVLDHPAMPGGGAR